MVRRPNVSSSLLAALGAIVLANSRPYEGLILTVAAVAALGLWRRIEKRSLKSLFARRVVMPAAIVLLVGTGCIAYYNYRVTGKPWLMPGVVNGRTYSGASQFWLVPEGPSPTYRHDVIRRWAEWYAGLYRQTRANPLRVVNEFLGILSSSYSRGLLLSVLAALVLAPTRKVRMAFIVAGIVAVGLLMEITLEPHYYAPAACLIAFLGTTGIRSLIRVARSLRADGIALMLFIGYLAFQFEREIHTLIRRPVPDFVVQRREVIHDLMTHGSSHLVIVRYSADHNFHREWVQNLANIDDANVIWAHDMGENNRELLDYYQNRKVWLLEADSRPPTLVDYFSSTNATK
jgi:hypothetical protein